MKAYLDTNIISAIAKDDTPSESHALHEILALGDAGDIELVTSAIALVEIESMKGSQNFEVVKETYQKFGSVSFIDDHEVLGFHSQWDQFGGVSYPFVRDDSTSSALWEIGIERMDAHHIMVAIRAGCEVFLSCDKGVLRRGAKIEGQFHIEAMKPSDFLKKLS